jgi:hypothetical protein
MKSVRSGASPAWSPLFGCLAPFSAANALMAWRVAGLSQVNVDTLPRFSQWLAIRQSHQHKTHADLQGQRMRVAIPCSFPILDLGVCGI